MSIWLEIIIAFGVVYSLTFTVKYWIDKTEDSEKRKSNDHKLDTPSDFLEDAWGRAEKRYEEENSVDLFDDLIVEGNVLSRMAFANDLYGCGFLSDKHDSDNESDLAIGIQALREKLHSDNSEALLMVGSLLHRGHIRKVGRDNKKEALSYLQMAAHTKNSQAQCLLGRIYFHGDGADVDYNLARLYLSQAVESDEYSAFEPLIKIYTDGLGVDVDAAKASMLEKRRRKIHDNMFDITQTK